MTVSRHCLTRAAFGILVQDLEERGNVLSEMHRAALYELVDAFAGYVAGDLEGRRAFPLPTGMGKTSAVVALAAALHRLGLRVPVSVAASRVHALSALKRDMLAHGIPEGWIGLKHSAQTDASGELLPSTGAESRLVQLVTHARVRGGTDFDLFGHHEGQPRPLTIYDETLLRADAFAFRARSLFAGVAALEVELAGTGDSLQRHLLAYLQDSRRRIEGALRSLEVDGDPYSNGREVLLGELTDGELKALQSCLSLQARHLRGFDAELGELLTLSQGALRVVHSEQGGGLVTAREVVPLGLRNVVVLDASAPIRELARLDPTITVVQSFDPAELKSFRQVEVRQVLSHGGRHSMTQSFKAGRREASAVSREVAQVIREGWASEEAFLVFTFVQRGAFNMQAELRRDLAALGVDLEARTPEGKPRINWLTWGQETSLNGYEHCTSVLMAGVLHRAHLDLAAIVRGQTGNHAEPTPGDRIRALVESEVASCLYQGASRGSCRRVVNGEARPMRLWFIHRDQGMRRLLDKVMPGAQWSYPDPQHLKKAAAETVVARMQAAILAHLRGLPQSVDKVSSRALKVAMGLDRSKAHEHAFTRAAASLDLEGDGWVQAGRSLVRGAAAHDFPSSES